MSKDKGFKADPYIPFTLLVLAIATFNAFYAPNPDILVWVLGLITLFTGLWGVHILDMRMGGYTNHDPKHLNIEGYTFLALAVAIGVYLAFTVYIWFILLVSVGVFLAIAYNLELFNGLLHDHEGGFGYAVFGIAWGFIPAWGSSLLMGDHSISALVMAIGWGALVIPVLRLFEASKPVPHEKIGGIDIPGDGPDKQTTKEWVFVALTQLIPALWILAIALILRTWFGF